LDQPEFAMPKRNFPNTLRRFLGIVCCVCLILRATHSHAATSAWELPGIQAALLSHESRLQHAAILHISRFEHPINNPELAATIQALKADPTLELDFLETLAALANLGVSNQSDEPQLLKIIQDAELNSPGSDSSQQADALKILARSPHLAKYFPLLAQLLSDPKAHIHVRYEAAQALGHLGPVALPDLLKVLRDRQQDPWIRGAAAQGLSQMGDAAKPYIPDIGNLLREKITTIAGQDGAVGAARALSRLGAKAYLPDIYQFVKDPDTQPTTDANGAMAVIFADFGPMAHGYVPQLITLLQQPEQAKMAHSRAIAILGKWGDAAKPALPWLTKLAQNCHGEAALAIARLDPNQSGALQNTLRCATQFQDQPASKGAQIALASLHEALEEWAKWRGGLDIPTIVPLLNIKPENMQWWDTSLRWYRLSGGRSDVLELLKQFDDNHRGKMQQVSRTDALKALAAMDEAWDASPDLPQVRSTVAEQMGLVIFGSQWNVWDLGRLQGAYDRLKPAYPKPAGMIAVKLTSLWRGMVGLILGGVVVISVMTLIGRGLKR
jgi:HEAT repeat protein